MSRREVAITGIGCISPLGFCPGELSSTLADGHSAIGEIDGFDAGAYSCRFGAEVPGFELADFIESKKTYIDRTSAFALAACSSALREAHWQGDEGVGLVLGTAWGSFDGEGEGQVNAAIGIDQRTTMAVALQQLHDLIVAKDGEIEAIDTRIASMQDRVRSIAIASQ